jgi:hypothetical protein
LKRREEEKKCCVSLILFSPSYTHQQNCNLSHVKELELDFFSHLFYYKVYCLSRVTLLWNHNLSGYRFHRGFFFIIIFFVQVGNRLRWFGHSFDHYQPVDRKCNLSMTYDLSRLSYMWKTADVTQTQEHTRSTSSLGSKQKNDTVIATREV